MGGSDASGASAGRHHGLRVTTAEFGADAVVVALHGEFDLAEMSVWDAALQNVEGGRRSRLVIDTRQLRFCDSTGLHAFVRAHNSAVAAGRSMTLVVEPGELIDRLVEVTGLREHLDVASSFEPPASDAPPTDGDGA